MPAPAPARDAAADPASGFVDLERALPDDPATRPRPDPARGGSGRVGIRSGDDRDARGPARRRVDPTADAAGPPALPNPADASTTNAHPREPHEPPSAALEPPEPPHDPVADATMAKIFNSQHSTRLGRARSTVATRRYTPG